jgi:hypothetical protein
MELVKQRPWTTLADDSKPLAFVEVHADQRPDWRSADARLALHLVALVGAGATFSNGKLIEAPAEDGGEAESEAT